MLTAPVPLRTTAAWPGFRDLAPLFHVYGQSWVKPLWYRDEGSVRVWFIADHASQGVNEVLYRRAAFSNWEFANTIDVDGHPITILRTSIDVTESDDLAVHLRGKTDGLGGELLTNLGDCLYDLIVNIAGETRFSRADFDGARTRFADRPIAGVIDGAASSLRSQIQALVGSVAGGWSYNTQGFAVLYPVATVGNESVYARLDKSNIDSVVSEVRLDDHYSHIVLLFHYDWAQSGYRQAITLQAPNVERDGALDRALTIEAPFINAPGVAFEVAQAFLQERARPRVYVTLQTSVSDAMSAPAGGYVTVDHPHCPINGSLIIADTQPDWENYTVTLALRGSFGALPVINLASQSVQVDLAGLPVVVERADDIVVINTEPNAQVCIGNRCKLADAAGVAAFTGIDPTRTYRLVITHPDFDNLVIDPWSPPIALGNG